MFMQNKWMPALLSGGLLFALTAFHSMPRVARVKTSSVASAPSQSAWAAIIGAHVPLQGVRWQRAGSPPIALGWTYSPTDSPVGFSGLRVMRLVWRGGRWSPDGILRITNGNFAIGAKSNAGPDHSIVLASEWASGGTDGAGAFVNIVATAQQLMAFRMIPVALPTHLTLGSSRIRETSASTVVQLQWANGRWHQKNLGILATIPSNAYRIHWAVDGGVITVRPSRLIHIAANRPIAVLPPTPPIAGWSVLGPFSSVATAQQAVSSGDAAMYTIQRGIVMIPPLGTSVWVVGVNTDTGPGTPMLRPFSTVVVVASPKE